jgi:hypothetical protein
LERDQIEDRIRTAATNTDKLIIRLDTLTNRIDTAKANDNRELVEYYERQFAEASVEFLDGVETILDDWYALKGEPRPPAEDEYISPEALEGIHNTVVSIVQGLPVEMPAVQAEDTAGTETRGIPAAARGPRHRVDVTG